MSIRIGCGSWSDQAYSGLLYPRGLPPELRLSAYAMWFNHVEVNSTYYSTPKRDQVRQWVKSTPDSFLFDVRLHRAFSRSPDKTTRAGRLLPYLLEGLQPMLEAKKLGAFLLVLTPSFSPERHRLDELDALIKEIRPHALAVELRHAAWVSGENCASTLRFFRERGLTWVAVDMPRIKGSQLMPTVDEVTQPKLAYLRLHGRSKNYLQLKSAAEKHTYAYDAKELREIADRVVLLQAKAKQVRVVANNHAYDFAPNTAMDLIQLLK